MMRNMFAAAAAIALAGCAAASTSPQGVRLTAPPQELSLADQQVLFWDDATRTNRFAHMEDHFAGIEVQPAARVRKLPAGTPFDPATRAVLDTYLAQNHTAGIMVLQDGRVRYEGYAPHFGPEGRWTSFSVAKSFTSTLLGAAVKDGFIKSMADPVTRYLPALAGTAYDGVSVEQLATMTSGVKWNEDYADPASDVAQMLQVAPVTGESQAVTYARKLTREAPAGQKWVYKTLETNLLGDLVAAATGKSLAAYAKTKIVDPAGFAGPMFWMSDRTGNNIGGCCISLRLADYARMGQFALEGGQPSVPAGWFVQAGAPQVDFGDAYPLGPGYGYGYQWWAYPGGNYGAQGIFGQAITIVPERRLVIAIVSNWPRATGREFSLARLKLVEAVTAASGR
jgi:CubicO group peptidase (beta-lactamase class C family)